MSSTVAYPSMYMGPVSVARVDSSARVQDEAAPRRAVLLGTTDTHVSSLLTDVLRDININVQLAGAATGAPDAVLAMVERVDGVQVITDAKSRFPGTPIIAILPLGVHRLATRAVAAGAQACYLLDMPIDRLRGILQALLSESAEKKNKANARSSRLVRKAG